MSIERPKANSRKPDLPVGTVAYGGVAMVVRVRRPKFRRRYVCLTTDNRSVNLAREDVLGFGGA